jgi:hypothetical protein
MIAASAEFVLEGRHVDPEGVARLVGAEPTEFHHGVAVDRWVLAVRGRWEDGELPYGIDDLACVLDPLRGALAGRVDGIAAYLEAGGAAASFRLSVDSDRPVLPLVVEVPPEFCAWMDRLGAGVELEVRTLPERLVPGWEA